jgi:hypothetical protein
VAKKKTRVKNQQETARAYELGLEPPKRAVPKARLRMRILALAHLLNAYALTPHRFLPDHREHARGGCDHRRTGRRGGDC